MSLKRRLQGARSQMSDALYQRLVENTRQSLTPSRDTERILIETTVKPNREMLRVLENKYGFQLEEKGDIGRHIVGHAPIRAIPDIVDEPFVKQLWHVPEVGLAGLSAEDADKHVELDEVLTGMNIPEEARQAAPPLDIGIIDSGVTTHDFLRNNIADRDTLVGNNPDDTTGHGTAVASQAVNVNPNARIHSIKVFNDSTGDMGKAMRAIERLVKDGVPIINMSWGTGFYPPVDNLVDEISREYGTIFVSAAGNFGPGRGTVLSPGQARSSVAVGSVGYQLPSRGHVPEFSSRGPSEYGETKPDIAGFGGTENEGLVVAAHDEADGWVSWRGTSFACPAIAGAISLLYPRFNRDAPGHLLGSATRSTPNNAKGHGIPDVSAALQGGRKVSTDAGGQTLNIYNPNKYVAAAAVGMAAITLTAYLAKEWT